MGLLFIHNMYVVNEHKSVEPIDNNNYIVIR